MSLACPRCVALSLRAEVASTTGMFLEIGLHDCVVSQVRTQRVWIG